MSIRETVKQGQELMTLLMQSDVCQSICCDYGHYDHPRWPIQYPQSLGELCLEIASNHLRHYPGWVKAIRQGALTRDERGRLRHKGARFVILDIIPSDCHALRVAMYRKEKA
jgi:hypothetical protein